MAVEDVIIAAIRDKSSLEVMYRGFARLVSPIRFGWKTTEKDGRHKNLFCYQFGGYSSRGLGPEGSAENYRCWNMDEINAAVAIQTAPHGNYEWTTQPSNCIDDAIIGPLG
jgi:hypothetical protein